MQDFLERTDSILNGLYMGGANIASDFYEQRVLDTALRGNPSKQYKDLSSGYRKQLEYDRKRYLKTSHAFSSNRYTPIRDWIKSKGPDGKPNHTVLNWLTNSKDKMASWKGKRRMASDMVSGSMDRYVTSAGDRRHLDAVKNARSLRSWGTVAYAAMGASMAAGLASSAIRSTIDRGYKSVTANTSFSSEQFIDSQMAHTTRQRAQRAIQNSQSGMRRAFGNEASFLKSFQ